MNVQSPRQTSHSISAHKQQAESTSRLVKKRIGFGKLGMTCQLTSPICCQCFSESITFVALLLSILSVYLPVRRKKSRLETTGRNSDSCIQTIIRDIQNVCFESPPDQTESCTTIDMSQVSELEFQAERMRRHVRFSPDCTRAFGGYPSPSSKVKTRHQAVRGSVPHACQMNSHHLSAWPLSYTGQLHQNDVYPPSSNGLFKFFIYCPVKSVKPYATNFAIAGHPAQSPTPASTPPPPSHVQRGLLPAGLPGGTPPAVTNGMRRLSSRRRLGPHVCSTSSSASVVLCRASSRLGRTSAAPGPEPTSGCSLSLPPSPRLVNCSPREGDGKWWAWAPLALPSEAGLWTPSEDARMRALFWLAFTRHASRTARASWHRGPSTSRDTALYTAEPCAASAGARLNRAFSSKRTTRW
jgi:hypothetical protein